MAAPVPALKMSSFKAVIKPVEDGDVEAFLVVNSTSGVKASTTTIRFEGGADIAVLADEHSFSISISESGAPGGPTLEAIFQEGDLQLRGKGWGWGRGARPY